MKYSGGVHMQAHMQRAMGVWKKIVTANAMKILHVKVRGDDYLLRRPYSP
jgi:hypothetical protein